MDITKYKYNKYKLKYKLLKEQIMAGGNPEDVKESESQIIDRFKKIYRMIQVYYKDNIVKRYTKFKWFVTVQNKDTGVCLKKKIIDKNLEYTPKPSFGIYFSPNFLTLNDMNQWTGDTYNWIEWCIQNRFGLSKYDPNTSAITAIGIHYNNFITYKNKKFVYLASDTDVPDISTNRTFIYTINSQESLVYFLNTYGINSYRFPDIIVKWYNVSVNFGGINIDRDSTLYDIANKEKKDEDEKLNKKQWQWIIQNDVDQLIIWSKNTYTLCLNLSTNSPDLITPDTNPDIVKIANMEHHKKHILKMKEREMRKMKKIEDEKMKSIDKLVISFNTTPYNKAIGSIVITLSKWSINNLIFDINEYINASMYSCVYGAIKILKFLKNNMPILPITIDNFVTEGIALNAERFDENSTFTLENVASDLEWGISNDNYMSATYSFFDIPIIFDKISKLHTEFNYKIIIMRSSVTETHAIILGLNDNPSYIFDPNSRIKEELFNAYLCKFTTSQLMINYLYKILYERNQIIKHKIKIITPSDDTIKKLFSKPRYSL